MPRFLFVFLFCLSTYAQDARQMYLKGTETDADLGTFIGIPQSNFPEQTVGPLTVKIQAPVVGQYGHAGLAELSEYDKDYTVGVWLVNSSDESVSGTVEARVVDKWKAKPAGAVPFEVAPNSWQRVPFDVSFGVGTLNAHYPVHATVNFQHQGQKLEADPVLILKPKLPQPTQPESSKTRSEYLTPEEPTGMPISLGMVEGYQVRVWPGRRGMIDAKVEFDNGRKKLSFHGYRIQAGGDVLNPLESRQEPSKGYRVRHRGRSEMGDFDVVSEIMVDRGALTAKFWIENRPLPQPWKSLVLDEVTAGPWSEKATQIYLGTGNVLREPEAFRVGAGSYVGLDFANGFSLLQASDMDTKGFEGDPEKRIYSLRVSHTHTVTYLPAPTVWAAAKIWRDRTEQEKRPAPGVATLAGRFNFDIWSGTFVELKQDLEKAIRYGLTDSVLIAHNWQRWGYDYRYPDIFPPNKQLGTLEAMRDLIDLAKENDILFAPHDNYADFFPAAEGFTYDRVVFTAPGKPRKAWYNSSRSTQSYRGIPGMMRPMVERNIKLIQEGLAPNAYFTDVWCGAGGIDLFTQDGEFQDQSISLKDIRDAHVWMRANMGNAVQIVEAAGDQFVGWVDGTHRNHVGVDATATRSALRVDCEDAERIPWFDMVNHDRLILMGAGYHERYTGLDTTKHGVYSDDYVATEVLTGHPAMVVDVFSRQTVRKYWLLHDLMRELAMKRISNVEFVGGDLHRQKVTWENGTVWVNRGKTDWVVNGHTLPEYGFHARVGGVEAASVTHAGKRVEWSKSADEWYCGNYRLTRDKKGLLVTALPDGKPFEVRIDWDELPWDLPLPKTAVASNRGGKSRLKVSNGEVSFTYNPEVFQYRLK